MITQPVFISYPYLNDERGWVLVSTDHNEIDFAFQIRLIPLLFHNLPFEDTLQNSSLFAQGSLTVFTSISRL